MAVATGVTVMLLVGVVVVFWVWLTSCDGISFMPHSGQRSGESLTTARCIGQV